ncbi:uncharacterized protein RHO25_009065 [Cercospora beticola]|uniref:Thioredoxin domain-containing protein n=1 Tax=Cercospora beticola TaxID=122368 RepID=A0ABZ0NXV0_CERBT|nr:hypothetical protein RHO25_009065 [Cercospora beticola]CAK1356750.1 unnamed protein product [Cercospora beticola]
MAIELENKKQYDELIASTPTVIVFAHANYTANSRTFKSHFNSVADEKSASGKVAFAWYDAFDADDVNAELVVRTFPAYFVFQDGKRTKSVLSSLANPKQLDADVAELVG